MKTANIFEGGGLQVQVLSNSSMFAHSIFLDGGIGFGSSSGGRRRKSGGGRYDENEEGGRTRSLSKSDVVAIFFVPERK